MRTRDQLAARMILPLLALVLSVRCTTPTGALQLHRPEGQVAATLLEVKLPQGTECLVRLVSGQVVRGRFAGVTADQFELNVENVDRPWHRRIAHADIVLVAKVVPRGRRVRFGAAIGALLSLPLSISMVGDGVLMGAIAGGLIGYHSATPRADIVFARQSLSR